VVAGGAARYLRRDRVAEVGAGNESEGVGASCTNLHPHDNRSYGNRSYGNRSCGNRSDDAQGTPWPGRAGLRLGPSGDGLR
jgi:hypothetical protein